MQICKDLEGGECKAKVLLDKLCRNNTVVRTMVTSDYKTNIPLKDRCGVYWPFQEERNTAVECNSDESHTPGMLNCSHIKESIMSLVLFQELSV